MTNPLDPTLDGYKVAIESMKVTERVIRRGLPRPILAGLTFSKEPSDSSLAKIEAAKRQIDDLVVLNLVAVFERFLRDRLASLPRLSAASTRGPDRGLRRQILADLEYWKMAEEVLPLFTDTVDSNTIGQVKQAIGYRNWVAHGRASSRPPAAYINPQFAYDVLSRFLIQAGLL